jgi:F0F1-type ATP synthase delta subunit
MKIKHNKKRNTAFLFETLIREMTKAASEQETVRQAEILEVLKEFFSAGTVLHEELTLYKEVLKTANIRKEYATRLLNKVARQYSKLDKDRIFEAQSKLIKKLNTVIGNNVYSNHVPHYKQIATINQIFTAKLPAKMSIVLENDIIEYMSMPRARREEKKSDKLVFKMFLQRFNEKYAEELNDNQKVLLREYINSYNDNGLRLKVYMSEEIVRLGDVIKKIQGRTNDESFKGKLVEVSRLIESFSRHPMNDALLHKVLQIQSLVEGIEREEG